MVDYREITRLPNRLYAVGDIHACTDGLSLLLEYFENIAKIGPEDLIIFIGDYIDRGPDAKSSIDMLLKFRSKFPATIFLKGNHEDMLLSFLGFGGTLGESYLVNGGLTTAKSYGLGRGITKEEFLQRIPPEHLDFFKGLDRYVIAGEYVFAHAGLHPLKDLNMQGDMDLFWIRDEFISNIHNFNKTIVFGHTPYQDILFHLPYKIGIDTGYVYGNILTCVEVMEKLVIQVHKGEDEVRVATFEDKAGRG